jgi:LPXTG-motif cell wall-anchored protein
LEATGEKNMTDLIYVGLTLLFLALTYVFILVCERLMEDQK